MALLPRFLGWRHTTLVGPCPLEPASPSSFSGPPQLRGDSWSGPLGLTSIPLEDPRDDETTKNHTATWSDDVQLGDSDGFDLLRWRKEYNRELGPVGRITSNGRSQRSPSAKAAAVQLPAVGVRSNLASVAEENSFDVGERSRDISFGSDTGHDKLRRRARRNQPHPQPKKSRPMGIRDHYGWEHSPHGRSHSPLPQLAKAPAPVDRRVLVERTELSELISSLADPQLNAGICRGALTEALNLRAERLKELARDRRAYHVQQSRTERASVARPVKARPTLVRQESADKQEQEVRDGVQVERQLSSGCERRLRQIVDRIKRKRQLQSEEAPVCQDAGAKETQKTGLTDNAEASGVLHKRPEEIGTRMTPADLKSKIKEAVLLGVQARRKAKTRALRLERERSRIMATVTNHELSALRAAFDKHKNANGTLSLDHALPCLYELGLRGIGSHERYMVEQAVLQMYVSLTLGFFASKKRDAESPDWEQSSTLEQGETDGHRERSSTSVSHASDRGDEEKEQALEATIKQLQKFEHAKTNADLVASRGLQDVQDAELDAIAEESEDEEQVAGGRQMAQQRASQEEHDLADEEGEDGEQEEQDDRGDQFGTVDRLRLATADVDPWQGSSGVNGRRAAGGVTGKGLTGRHSALNGIVDEVCPIGFTDFCAELVPNVRRQISDSRCDVHVQEFSSLLDHPGSSSITLIAFENLIRDRRLDWNLVKASLNQRALRESGEHCANSPESSRKTCAPSFMSRQSSYVDGADGPRDGIADTQEGGAQRERNAVEFDVFHELLMEAEEKGERQKRVQEKTILAKTKLSPNLFSKFRSEIIRLYEIFQMYDTDASGFLNHSDVRRLLKHFGFEPHTGRSSAEIARFLQLHDHDGKKRMAFEEFLELLPSIRKWQRKWRRPKLEQIVKASVGEDFSRGVDVQQVLSIFQATELFKNRGEEDMAKTLIDETKTDAKGYVKFEVVEQIAQAVVEQLLSVAHERHAFIAACLGFSKRRLAELQMMYDALDEDFSGTLSIKEIEAVVPMLVKRPVEANDLAAVWKQAVGTVEEEMQFSEFLHLMKLLSAGEGAFADQESPFALASLEPASLREVLSVFRELPADYIHELDDSELAHVCGQCLDVDPEANLREDKTCPVGDMQMLMKLASDRASKTRGVE